jgi:glycosyltransferase involved in cell wall biosynthesis
MAATVLVRHPGCRFLIVGDDQRVATNYRAAMEALADDLGIAAACRFVGFRDDVWDVLHLCDVVVMPSHLEPFGNVAVEVGAAARALVATEVGGIPEIVRDGETGVLVPPQDPPALAAAVVQLLADPARRVSLGERARSHVRAHFSLAAQTDAVMNLYDAMLAGRSARSSDRARP